MQRFGHHNTSRRRATRAGLLALLTMLVAVPSAEATRYASPTSTDTTGFCTQASPCRLDHAVGGALLPDTIELAPGTYNVSYQVRATAAVTIRGAAGQARPRLVGTAGLGYPTLEVAAAGTVSGLDIETNDEVALQLSDGAKADGVYALAQATSSTAIAVRMVSSLTPTLLVNSVARSLSANTAVDMIDPALLPGSAKVLNSVVVIEGGNSWGVTTDLATQSPVVKNSYVRATSKDIHGRSGTMPVLASNSNFRAATSANFTDVGGNQSGAPGFVDAAAGDYHLTSGSPMVDAGAADGLLTGLTDLLGGLRVLGAAPDIGAFEWVPGTPDPTPPPAPTPPPTTSGVVSSVTNTVTNTVTDTAAKPTGETDLATALPPLAPPEMAKTVAVERSSGSPRIQLPGSTTYLPLTKGAAIPVGATVDASRGTVSLSSVRDATGKTQTGKFWGGVFQVKQTRGSSPMTELILKGGDFSRCPKAKRAGKSASAARSRHSTRMRRLWGRDKRGRFRTKGRNAHATVRGTVWLVEDRCDGTLTKVKEGAVMVRDLVKRRNVLVKAGKSYFARSR